MDILNWLRIKKQQLIRTTLDSPKDLVVLGADVSYQKRGDKYQSYAMPAEDFLATAARPYKVYTALLTQSGGDGPNYIVGDENIYKGVTYEITLNDANFDFTSFGSPDNNVGTKFVSTKDGVIITSGDVRLDYNSGAPVVTVLENTIGNVWFTYDAVGNYRMESDGLFTSYKTWSPTLVIQYSATADKDISITIAEPSYNIIQSALYGGGAYYDSLLFNTPIEIRVYN